jgi:tRNA (guanine37-N1)-methyltransferase
MIRVDVITVLPNFFQTPLEHGMLRIARQKQAIDVHVHNLRDYGLGKYKQVDDTPFGGGAGMVLRVEPFFSCIEALQSEREYNEIIFFSPDGDVFNQSHANEFALKQNIILLCGHYKAIDERIRETFVTRTISMGDYVLSGGELPALVFMDSVARLLPGVLNDSESMLLDSFQQGGLDCAHYTRPAEYRGMKVPNVLLSGDHKKIQAWREKNSEERTKKNRPDLIKNL